MRLLLISSVLSASILGHSVNADESGTSGYYARLFGAYASLDETDYGSNLGRLTTEFDDGFVVGGAVGLDTNWIDRETNALRLELEYTYRESDVDAHQLAGVDLAGSNGEFNANAFMTNVIFDMFKERPISAYIGGGIGVAFVNFDDFSVSGTRVLDDDEAVFAYRGIAGIEYAIDNQWSLFGEYRYFGMEEADVTLSPDAGGLERHLDMDSHNFGAGLRLQF
ncbi:MAG: outer membrane beta-barrel protein [Pseudomonadota bacterium]